MFNQLSSLDVFYLTGAIILLAVAIFYWADTRNKGKKKR
ncbi:MAG: hypothetical protein US60_C0027G0013 [Microgenomates group bacterium GW2011_GWC1_37_8]|nr:MAG: hypothetical protein US60_C0027G0013 [Microgenomates group bacterium GW2011_GWC1_37_8]